MGPIAPKTVTYEDLRRRESETGVRHEIQAGELVAMGGGSLVHAELTLAVGAELRAALRRAGCQCRLMSPDGRLRVDHDPDGTHRYPDVGVVCGDAIAHPSDDNAYMNPAVLVEVVSPKTAIFDRNGKRDIYLACASLRAYFVVSQDSRFIEVYRRDGAKQNFVAGDRIKIDDGPDGDIVIEVDAIYDGIL